MINLSNHSHGGDTQQFLNRYGLKGKQIYDFSVNTFPYPLPDEMIAILQQSIPAITQYPDIHNSAFIHSVSQAENIPAECIVPLNGSVQGMYALCSLPEIRSVITIEPTFIEYKLAAQVYQKPWDCIHRHHLQEIYELLLSIEPRSLVFVCNPNNPDGGVLSMNHLSKILEMVSQRNSWLIVDEAFIEFVPNESMMQAVLHHQHLIVLRSLTKFFALAGLRCGYLAAHPDTAAKIRSFIPPWPLNGLSQKAGEWVLNHSSYFYQVGETWKQQAQKLMDFFKTLNGIQVHPTATSYFLLSFENVIYANRFQELLAQKGIMVRNCGNYEGLDESNIRIGARDHESNTYLLETLQSSEFKEMSV